MDTPGAPGYNRSRARRRADTMFEEISQRRVIFVTGKGGVGKTTVAAALGLYLARRGRNVLLAEVDNGRPTLRGYFDRPIGFEPVRVAVHVDAANVEFAGALQSFLTEIVPVERLVRLILRNRIVRTFLLATPGAREVVVLSRLHQLACRAGMHRHSDDGEGGRLDEDERRWDHLIVDMPASGHAVSMFGTPRTIERLFKVGPLRTQADRVLRDFSDPEEAALLMVSISEEMSINETLETLEKVRAYGWPPLAGVLLNRFPAVAFTERDRELMARLDGVPGPRPGNLEAVLEAATAARIEHRRFAMAMIRLEREVGAAVHRLPFVRGGPVEVARTLAGMMAGVGGANAADAAAAVEEAR